MLIKLPLFIFILFFCFPIYLLLLAWIADKLFSLFLELDLLHSWVMLSQEITCWFLCFSTDTEIFLRSFVTFFSMHHKKFSCESEKLKTKFSFFLFKETSKKWFICKLTLEFRCGSEFFFRATKRSLLG